MVLSNGMAKTSHWAALYFVALMTFGNYVLFNLLVAILVEGFSAERNERREREQREMARKMSCILEAYKRGASDDGSRSISSSSDSCLPVSITIKIFFKNFSFTCNFRMRRMVGVQLKNYEK